MVARNNQAPNFGSTVAQGQLQGSQLGAARVDTAAAQAAPDAIDMTLSALVPSVSKVAETAFQTGLEEAYLEGVSRAATDQSEEALGQNPVTRDWELAGYRDTVGKLAHAEQEAKLIQDMPKLRQLPPEQFKEELGKRRAALLPQLEGMSRRQRESMLQQFAASEFTQIKQHAVEHQKWISEQRIAAIQAQAKSTSALYKSARATGDSSSIAAAGVKWQQVMQDLATDEAILPDAKSKLALQIGQFALADDQLPVYDLLMADKWGDQDNPMKQYLQLDDAVALSQAARQSEERTEGLRSQAWQNQDAALSASIDSGQLPDERDYQAHLTQGLQFRFISGGQYNSLMEAYYKKKADTSQSSAVAAAARAGDLGGLFRMGADDEKGVKAWEQTVRDQPLAAVVPQLIEMGNKGLKYASKRAGELTAGAWSELQFNPEKMLPENVQLLHQTVSQLDTLEQQGKKAAMAGYLSAFDDDTRSFIEQYRIHRRAGQGHVAAASKASETLKLHSGKTLQQKASGLAADQRWQDFKSARTSWYSLPGNAWAFAKDFVGLTDNSTLMRRLNISTGIGNPFSDKDEAFARAALAPIFNAVMDEAEKEAIRNPGNAGEPAMNIALAEVAGKRIIPTNETPILIPANVNVKALFGTNDSHTLADIGKAVDRLGKPADGFRRVYEMDRFGTLRYRDWNDKAQPGSEHILTPAAIKQSLLDMDKAKTAAANAVYGPGRVVKQGDVQFTYNGDNTAGVSNQAAYDLRQSLIKFEGIAAVVKPDVNKKAVDSKGMPVLTGGVGVSSTNTYFPKGVKAGDKLSNQQIQETFFKASDAALRQGKAIARQLGLNNDAALLFSSHLAYQAGIWINPNHPDPAMKDLVQAIAKRDKEAAIKAFERTTAAKYGEGRREWYKYQIRKMLG